MAKALKRKKNPSDATFRNVNALKKRVARLELIVARLLDLHPSLATR